VSKTYSGIFYVFFTDDVEYRIPWDSAFGLYPLEEPDATPEVIETIMSNIQVNTDMNGVISYSPAGPRFLSTYMDPRVIYLGLKLTFPDAREILYRGSLDDLEGWNGFTQALTSAVDENDNPIVS
jgi:hypothetical protein